ncbi:MAG TPA: TetR family transcriptional regulator [Acidimicrobiales bacterium]|nr:TetR family transcriptional regulator [Acidimicrobiales bacterium]
MSAGDTTFQRARRPEHKEQRRQAILEAAARLAGRQGVRRVSLTDIADQVGIHKSALLRYFETREEIFLELTAGSWREWAAAVRVELGAPAAAPGAAGAAGVVADVMARSFADRPLLCDLIPHTALNLERNVSVDAVRRYKLTSLGAIGEVTDAVHGVLPHLTVDECGEFVRTLASLAGALWQIANPPPPLAELYRSDPAFASACVDLGPHLQRTAAVVLAGLVPSRTPD